MEWYSIPLHHHANVEMIVMEIRLCFSKQQMQQIKNIDINNISVISHLLWELVSPDEEPQMSDEWKLISSS